MPPGGATICMSAEPTRQFVDTTVLVYAHDRSAGAKQARARTLIERLWNEGGGCLSVQILQEFFVTITRKVRHPLDDASAETLVRQMSNWEVFAPEADDVLAAIALCRKAGIGFWDAMILHSATELGCDVVWSEDLSTGQSYAGVVVRSPFEPAP
jgi:predicted nucleic acid-binding protein